MFICVWPIFDNSHYFFSEWTVNIRYSGKLTKDDYLAFMKLNSRPVLKKGGLQFDFWVMSTVIGGSLLLLSAVTLFQGKPSQSNPFPWYMLELIVGVSLS